MAHYLKTLLELSKLTCLTLGALTREGQKKSPVLGVHCDPRVHPQLWLTQEGF